MWFSLRFLNDRAKLRIYNPKVEDHGRYTLKAYTKDMNSSTEVTLHVLSKFTQKIYLLKKLFHLQINIH